MDETRSRQPVRQSLAATGVILALQVLTGGRARGENHADFKYENYSEENGRIQVETYGILVEQALNPKLTLRGQAVYDGISGATPTGMPPPVGSTQVALTHMDDIRRAGNLAVDLHLANHTLSPLFAYSQESDYRSIGVAFTDAIDFNQKNTTLIIGASHDFDTVEPKFWNDSKTKDSTDLIIGVNQLLDPKTVVTCNFSFGMASGYLADPYKLVRFDGLPPTAGGLPEQRPDSKTKEIGYLSLTRFVDPLNGSAEISYRFYHDSFDIISHTVGVDWNQKIGKYVVLTPLFRWDEQSAAYFYGVRFPGDPTDPASPVPIPKYYSADYRLSALSTYTYGVRVMAILTDHIKLDLAYKRYNMIGNDHVTLASAYPTANIFTVGVRASW
jgi:hypothetical protein